MSDWKERAEWLATVESLEADRQQWMARAEAAEAALGLGQRQRYSDEDYLMLHKAHCLTAGWLAEAERAHEETAEKLNSYIRLHAETQARAEQAIVDLTYCNSERARLNQEVANLRAALASRTEK